MTMKTKQRMLTEDWEIFKQRRLIEEQVRLLNRQITAQKSDTLICKHALCYRIPVKTIDSSCQY